MQLNELKDNDGARKSRIRVGRGIGCTKGKTCCKESCNQEVYRNKGGIFKD